MSMGVLALVLTMVMQTTESFDGLMNGDFERILRNGYLGTDTTKSVDGAFWMNAEGRTESGSSNRYLRLDDAFVVQRVGARSEKTASAQFEVDVRLLDDANAAALTLSEASGESEVLDWHLTNVQDPDNNPFPNWSAWEYVVSTGIYHPMDRVYKPMAKAIRYEGTINPANIVASTTTFGRPQSGIPEHELVIRWTAPRDGRIRIMMRPSRIGGSDQPELTQSIYLEKNSSTTLLRSDVFESGDKNGPVILQRSKTAGVDVQQGDSVTFRMSQSSSSTAGLNSGFAWNPAITYEGRRLTYYFKGPNAPQAPSSTSGQAYVEVPLTSTAWNRFGAGHGSPAFNAGADFAAAFFADTRPEPYAPLEVELSTVETNIGEVDFDNLECRVEWTVPTEDGLVQAILDEAAWIRDQSRLLVDRDGSGMYPKSEGPKETPFQVRQMKIVSGPSATAFLQRPGVPYGIELSFDERFNELDQDDRSWIWEQWLRNTASARGLLTMDYDAILDDYNPDIGATALTSTMESLVDNYWRTFDVTYLDAAYAYAQNAIQNGVLTSGIKTDLIFPDKYDVADGMISDPTTFDKAFENLQGAAAILVAYGACRHFNEAHPSLPGGRRFPSGDLGAWLTVSKTAIDRALLIKSEKMSGGTYDWGGKWQAYHGQFNDLFGYLSISALEAYHALEPYASDSAVMPLVDLLNSPNDLDGSGDFVRGLCAHFYPMWEQGVARYAFAAGDHTRPWDSYITRILDSQSTGVSGIDIDQYEEALVLAALNGIRFQFRNENYDGIWTGGALDIFQTLDKSGNAGTPLSPPNHYARALAVATLMPNTTDEQKRYLRAVGLAMLETTVQHYRATYGYWHHVTLDQFVSDPVGGAGTRAIGSMMEWVSVLDPVDESDLSTVTISPATLMHDATSGPVVFQFELTVPNAITSSDALDQLNNRTKIDRWTDDGTGQWVRTNLWPSSPQSFHPPATSPTDPTFASLTLIAATVPMGFDVKFSTVTWETDGPWTRNTSFQEWGP